MDAPEKQGRGRPPKLDDKRTYQLRVALSPAELAIARERAAESSESLAEFARRKLLGKKNLSP